MIDSYSIKGAALPHSIQAAETEALWTILELKPLDCLLDIYTDSDWTAKAATI